MLKLLAHLGQAVRGRRVTGPRLAAALAACLCLACPAVGQAATFTAALDRDTITLGESVTLSLAFGGATPQNLPTLPAVPNLTVIPAGTSTQMSFNFGSESSSTVTYSFNLTPQQPGDYAIPALTADVGGQHLTTQPLNLKVLKPSAPPPEAANAEAPLAFLKLVLPKNEVYVGETIVAQLHVYLNGKVQRYGGLQPTSFPAEGFNIGNSLYGQAHQTQVGNAVYTVVPVNIVLKAIKTGPLTVGPVSATITVELPSANRRRDPFFEQFGMRDPFDRVGDQKQLALTAEAVTVQSLPLPRENAPAGFTGAVGTYSMTFSAGPTNVAAGDPITVKVQIAGRGSVDALSLPEQPAWHDFKVYPPTTHVKMDDQLGIQGTKFFEQLITPQTADIKELPAISFSFFDPELKTYRTLAQPPVPLVVRPGGATPAPTIVGATRPGQDNAPPAQDIVPNKQRLGALAQVGPPLVLRSWFLALQGVPLLAFVSALVWRKRTESLANNPRLRRQRQVSQLLAEGLRELRGLAATNQPEQFFALLSHLLQEQLGERLDLPASAITEAVIEERLRPLRVPESTLARLQELFHTCNLARYAPIKSGQELAALIPKLEAVLAQLQEIAN